MNKNSSLKYKLYITFARENLDISSNGKSSIYDLKQAISKKYEVPLSSLVFRIGEKKKKFDLPDNTLLSNSEIQPGQTIFVSCLNQSKKQTSQSDNSSEFNQTPDQNGFIMIRRIIPADNSCLFNAVTSAIERKRNSAKYLRQVVATYVASEPEKYNEAVLEMSNEKYQKWILGENNWGGAIETEILSKHFNVEICVIDSHSLTITTFGDDQGYDKRIYLLYSGSHYDMIARNICEDMDAETDITVFSPRDKFALDGAFILAKEVNYKSMEVGSTDDDFEEDHVDNREINHVIPYVENYIPPKEQEIKKPEQCHKQASRGSRFKNFFKKLL